MRRKRDKIRRITAGEYEVVATDGTKWTIEKIDEATGWRLFSGHGSSKKWSNDFDTKREALAWIRS